MIKVLSSYVDLVMMPVQQRQAELLKQYKFDCVCSLCTEEKHKVSVRSAMLCTSKGCSGLLPLPGQSVLIPACFVR